MKASLSRKALEWGATTFFPLPPSQEDMPGETEAPDEVCEFYQWGLWQGRHMVRSGRELYGKACGSRRAWNCGPVLDVTALIPTETDEGVTKYPNGLTVCT